MSRERCSALEQTLTGPSMITLQQDISAACAFGHVSAQSQSVISFAAWAHLKASESAIHCVVSAQIQSVISFTAWAHLKASDSANHCVVSPQSQFVISSQPGPA